MNNQLIRGKWRESNTNSALCASHKPCCLVKKYGSKEATQLFTIIEPLL